MKASEPRPKMMHRAVFLWSQPMLVRRDSVEIMGRSVVKKGQQVWGLGLDLVSITNLGLSLCFLSRPSVWTLLCLATYANLVFC